MSIETLRNAVWGIPTLALLLFFGIYFTCKSGFYRPRAVLSTLKHTVFSLRRGGGAGISPLSAAATALGGTVGVGSIVGVGYAITVGGAGSIFWMWVCSFFGMGLKYAEVKTALTERKTACGIISGGAPFLLRSLGYKRTALFFCIACLLASFTTGNITQIGAAALLFSHTGLSRVALGLLSLTAVALAVFGGRRRIAAVNSVFVPSASAVYIIACAVILVMNSGSIADSFFAIFRSAFGLNAVGGGFSGAVLAHTLREGFARSMFSNESGMGSSPLVHATAEAESPDIQARWGIFEVFFDTFVVSTLTALCLLSSGNTEPFTMFSLAFGKAGGISFGILISVFALASLLSWCYYAECCLAFIFPNGRYVFYVYRACFAISAFCGVFLSGGTALAAADIFNALMMFPNLFLLYLCRNGIERME